MLHAARRLGASGAMLAALLAAGPALALHQESPPAVKITTGGPHLMSPGRAWENLVVFSATEDLASLGAARVAGRQIFLFNLAYYDCFRGLTQPGTPCPSPLPPFLQQVTNGPGNPDNPSVASADASGNRWLAFDADGTFGGGAGGQASRRQIFLLNLGTAEIRQVTSASNGDSVRPQLGVEAILVAFESTAPLAGFPNPGGVTQLFVFERASHVLRQLTFGAGPSRGTSVNGDVIAFESTIDLLGAGTDTGVSQIFWSVYNRQTHAGTLRQLTHGNAPSHRPFVTDQNAIAFDSSATNLPGGGSGAGIRIFLSSRVDGPATPTLQQLTSPSVFGDCIAPSVGAGGRVAIICTGDPLANGTTGRRLFVLDPTSNLLWQITGAGDVEAPIGTNIGEWFVSFATTSDLTATGACGYQLYVVDYNAGFWEGATQPGQLPPDAGRTVVCNDGNFCNGQEACNASGGCIPGTPPLCNDGNACTSDTCNGVQGCIHAPAAGACNDQSLCTTGDTCQQGACVGTPVPCGDGNACNGAETCNPATGGCQSGPAPVCNDGNVCTNDSCNPASGCVHANNSLPCDDGDPCSNGDVCQAGTCAGVGPTCGNAVVECGENCDDGAQNGTPGHACTAACVELPPALRIPGGTRANECTSEWSLALGTVATSRGLPSTRQTCVDGDPTCDFDPTPGRCRLHLWECFGGADARLACPATGVGSAAIQLPRPTQSAGATTRQALLDALSQVGFPIPPGETCTRRIDVDLLAGARQILATLAYPVGTTRDRDLLRVRCAPTP
jgi:hypothetical protein